MVLSILPSLFNVTYLLVTVYSQFYPSIHQNLSFGQHVLTVGTPKDTFDKLRRTNAPIAPLANPLLSFYILDFEDPYYYGKYKSC